MGRLYSCMKAFDWILDYLHIIFFGRYLVSIEGGPNNFFGTWDFTYLKNEGEIRDWKYALHAKCRKISPWAKIWVGIHNEMEEPFWLRTLCSYKSTTVKTPVRDHPKFNKDFS